MGWSAPDRIKVQSFDLCQDLIGHINLGDMMLRGEISVYNWLDRLSQEYSGGYWHYYEIPNGFYMAPAD